MTWRRSSPYSSFPFHCYSHPAYWERVRINERIARDRSDMTRGNGRYIDPRTGAELVVPNLPPDRPYTSGGETYVRDQGGDYFRWAGNGWVALRPGS